MPADDRHAPDQVDVLIACEHDALRKRLAEIEVALADPKLTAGNSAALMRERARLEQAFALCLHSQHEGVTAAQRP